MKQEKTSHKDHLHDALHDFVERNNFRPNTFITLVAWKSVSKERLRDGFQVLTGMMEKKIYGRYSKKIIRQLPVIEMTYGGYNHIHTLMELEHIDNTRRFLFDYWGCHKRQSNGRKMGIKVGSRVSTFDRNQEWFKTIFDLDGIVEYASKHITNPQYCEVCYEFFDRKFN